MLEIKKYIETKDEKYPVIFSFNVLEDIQNKYGSFDNWSHIIEGEKLVDNQWQKGEARISDIKYFIKLAISNAMPKGAKAVISGILEIFNIKFLLHYYCKLNFI